MKSVMRQLNAVGPPGSATAQPPSSTPPQSLVPEAGRNPNPKPNSHDDSASTRAPQAAPQGDDAVGWCLSVFSHAEEAWMRGEVLSCSLKGKHHVLYEDGEDEWLKLSKEQVQWHTSRSTIAQTAGLQPGKRLLAPVGCRFPGLLQG